MPDLRQVAIDEEDLTGIGGDFENRIRRRRHDSCQGRRLELDHRRLKARKPGRFGDAFDEGAVPGSGINGPVTGPPSDVGPFHFDTLRVQEQLPIYVSVHIPIVRVTWEIEDAESRDRVADCNHCPVLADLGAGQELPEGGSDRAGVDHPAADYGASRGAAGPATQRPTQRAFNDSNQAAREVDGQAWEGHMSG